MQRSTLFQVELQVLILLSVLSVAQIQVEQLWSSCQVGAHPLCQCSLKTEQMRLLLYLEPPVKSGTCWTGSTATGFHKSDQRSATSADFKDLRTKSSMSDWKSATRQKFWMGILITGEWWEDRVRMEDRVSERCGGGSESSDTRAAIGLYR